MTNFDFVSTLAPLVLVLVVLLVIFLVVLVVRFVADCGIGTLRHTDISRIPRQRRQRKVTSCFAMEVGDAGSEKIACDKVCVKLKNGRPSTRSAGIEQWSS
jgi:hypothetical protein